MHCSAPVSEGHRIMARIEDGIVRSPFPAPKLVSSSIFAYLRDAFKSHGDKIALIERERKVSYRDVLEQLSATTASLEELGVGRRDRVYALLENGIDCFIAICAVTCTGAAVILSHPLFKKDEIVEHVRDLNVTHILTDAVYASRFSRQDIGTKTWLSVGEVAWSTNLLQFRSLRDHDCASGSTDLDDVMVVSYSSGTTGVPKFIEISGRSLLLQIEAERIAGILSPDDTCFEFAGVTRFMGFAHCLVATCCGSTFVIESRFLDSAAASVCILENKATRVIGNPKLLKGVIENILTSGAELPSVRALISLGAPLPSALATAIAKACPNLTELRNAYGLSETCGIVTAPPIGLSSQPDTVGLPLPGIRLKVVDQDTGVVLGPRQLGEVLVQSTSLMKGYSNKPGETAAVIESGWLHTGDLGYYDEYGWLFLYDRIKLVIHCSGGRVSPHEMEDHLVSHPKVSDAAVLGIPRADSKEASGHGPEPEEVLAALVVVRKGHRSDKELAAELISYTAGRVPPWKQLHGGIFFVAKIPRTDSGKIARRLLQHQFELLHINKGRTMAPLYT
ncbi:uncharacterized protein LOC144165261 isoform X1 [Haemaphysalis longicornis]